MGNYNSGTLRILEKRLKVKYKVIQNIVDVFSGKLTVRRVEGPLISKVAR